MTAPTREVWFHHTLCGSAFQDSAGEGHCPGCGDTDRGRESVLRHEFQAESPDFAQFLASVSRVYTRTRWDELSEILANTARVQQTTPS